jgi:chromosome segregation ATPase
MEFLAKLAGKRDVAPDPMPPQVTRFEEFLAKVRGERERLENLVATIKGEGPDGVPQVMARLEERASALTQLMDDVGQRADQMRQATSGVDALETRIAELEGLVLRAEVRANEDVQRSEELGRRSEALQALVALAQNTLERLDGKLDDLSQCQVLSFDASADLQNLNALAERVNVKLKALEHQQQTIDRALLDSRRVSEMVWEMDAQIARLREGTTIAANVEETLTRLDRLHQTVAEKLEAGTRDGARFGEDMEDQQRKAAELLHAVQTQMDRLTVSRSEIDTIDQRLRAAESGLANTDRQLAALAASERALSTLQERMAGFATRTDALATEIVRIEQKQPLLDALDGRLDEVDAELRKSTIRLEGLIRRRQELDAIKAEFDACEATYAQVRARADELRDQKHQFSAFAEQARIFMRETPELDVKIRQLQERVGETGDLAEKAIAMRPQIEELGGRLELLAPRLPLMEELQARLSALSDLSGDIDHRLAAQVDRQADLEQARVVCDGLTTQITDAQQKLATLEGAQARLASVPGHLADIEARLADARNSVSTIQHGQDAVAGHRRQLADLHQHLTQIQNIEREAFERHQEAEQLLEQCSTRWKHVDERRADLAVVEQSIAGVDARIRKLERLTEALDSKISVIADRDRVVDAVKQEIDAVHEIARRCHDDLGAIADQRAAISQTRDDVDRLAGALAVADEKLVEVERRSTAVEDVRRKAEAVVQMLDDVRVTLDTVGEQKAMVDHVTEMLAQFEDAITEARGTTRALQAERKLAQRIVENVRHIHARAGQGA